MILQVLTVLLLLVGGQAFADENPKVAGGEVVELNATVESVNSKTREIKFKRDDGSNFSITAGEEVQNFKQIKKGDQLKIRYAESVMIQLAKPDSASSISKNEVHEVTRAEPGKKPGQVAVDQITATAVVTKVDKKNQMLTLRGPERTVDVKVTDKSILDRVKKGDRIQATYTEATAIFIESAKK